MKGNDIPQNEENICESKWSWHQLNSLKEVKAIRKKKRKLIKA